MSDARRTWLEAGVLALASVVLGVLALVPGLVVETLSPLEVAAVVSSAWCVWLLARNQPLGWWVGLVGVSVYALVFFRARLYGEVVLQGFYFATSLQAIWVWLRTGPAREERPVGRVPARWLVASAVAGALATWWLREQLLLRGGAAPFWDALTTVVSVIAHLFLMARCVESWYLWIAVDTIYVPLYHSRGLPLTSGLSAVLWLLALRGLLEFRRLHAAQALAEVPGPLEAPEAEPA